MRIIETKVFQYEELEERAKEKAREWFRGCIVQDIDWSDCVIDDAKTFLAYLGFSKPSLYWSIYDRDEHVSIVGSWYCSDLKLDKKSDYGDKVAEFFDELQAFKARFPHSSANCSSHHYYGTRISVDLGSVEDDEGNEVEIEDTEEREIELKEIIQGITHYILKDLKAEYDYQTSDEVLAEGIISNEYEFTEEGERV